MRLDGSPSRLSWSQDADYLAKAIAEASPLLTIGAWEYHPELDRLIISPTLRRIIDWTSPEITDFASAFLREDRPGVRRLLRFAEGNPGTYQGEYRALSPEGLERFLLVVCRSVEEPFGTRLVGICQDVTDWRRAEVGLRDREERWKLAIQGSNFGVWDWDLRTNKLTVSGQLAEMLGYPSDHVPSPFELWTEHLHPEDRRPTLLALREHIKGRTAIYRMEHRLRHVDGTYRWVLSRGSAVRDEEGHAFRVTGIGTDITRRVETRQALERSEARLRAVFDGSFDGLLILDAVRGPTDEIVDFTFVDANDQAIIMLECTEAELIGASLFDVCPDGRECGHFKNLKSVVERQERTTYEGMLSEKYGDGRRFRIQILPLCSGAAVTLSDVTERRQHEVALRETEKLVNQITAAVPEFLYVFDLSAAIVTYRNRSLRSALGYSDDPDLPLEEASVRSMIHPDDLPALLASEAAVIENPHVPSKEAELRVRRVDGSYDWIAVRHSAFAFSPDGAVSQILGSVSIITDKKEAEQRVREHVLELHRTQAELQARHAELQRLNDRLSHLARKDGLTEVYNHRAFQERLGEEVARSRRNGNPLTLMLADVDDFKAFNDRFGHVAGDERLQYFAAVLERCTRPSDFVARYGGEEFAVILPEASAAQGVVVAERIIQMLGDEDSARRISASLGVAEFGLETPTPTALIAAADSALYLAKQTGKNRVSVARPGTRLG